MSSEVLNTEITVDELWEIWFRTEELPGEYMPVMGIAALEATTIIDGECNNTISSNLTGSPCSNSCYCGTSNCSSYESCFGSRTTCGC